MKKLLSLGIAAAITLGMTACGGTTNTVTTGSQNSSSKPISTSSENTVSQATQITQTMPPETIAVTIPSTTTAVSTTPRPEVAKFYPANTKITIDLNNDGEKEELLYTVKDFLINGKSVTEFMNPEIFMNEPNTDRFIVADINTDDEIKEIGILINGSSDDYETFFFRYLNNEVWELGSVPVIMDDLKKAFDGGGYIYGSKRLSVLQTWYAPARWKLEGASILPDPDDLYYPLTLDNQKAIVLKEELPIYTQLGDAAPSGTIKPQEVEFLATDNSNWCQIKGKDGTTGWFKLQSFDYLLDLDKNVQEVFDNLFSAD